MATGKLHEKVAGRELGAFVIPQVEEVILNKCFSLGCLEENSKLPAEMMAGPKARSILLRCTQEEHIYTAEGLPASADLAPRAPVGSFLEDNAHRVKPSVQWPQ